MQQHGPTKGFEKSAEDFGLGHLGPLIFRARERCLTEAATSLRGDVEHCIKYCILHLPLASFQLGVVTHHASPLRAKKVGC